MDGASSTAQNFKVPKMLIGLTIVAFGTSAPEFAVSMSALTMEILIWFLVMQLVVIF